MKKFIGAIVFAVIVVAFMVVQLNKEHRQQNAVQQPFTQKYEGTSLGNEVGDTQVPPMQATANTLHQAKPSEAQPPQMYTEHEQSSSVSKDSYVPPQPSSLAELEALRQRSGHDIVNLALVPYQLDLEPVDHQWFRRMEDALYRVSYNVFEPQGIRIANLQCATSVCTLDLDAPPGSGFSAANFVQALRDNQGFSDDELSVVFINQGDTTEQIIFQRKNDKL